MGKTFGEMTPAEKRTAMTRARDQLQRELTAAAPHIARVLDEFDAEQTRATTVTLHNVPTHQLQLGDVVLDYGMRIKLDQLPRVYHGGDWSITRQTCADNTGLGGNACCVVYSWLGTVTNVDQVRLDGTVPISWLRHHESSHPGEHVWNVQGNHLATWTVERAAS